VRKIRHKIQFVRVCVALVASLFATAALTAAAQSNWKVVDTFHAGGDGGWDYVTTDASHHRLFVTRSTHTIAVDENTGKVLGDIPGQTRSHGVALVPELGRGFISDGGGAGAIVVFDLSSYAVLGKIPAVADVDGIIYDAKLKRVLVVSGDGNELLTFNPAIDLKTGKLDPPIPLGGAPEFLASDGSGKAYINLEDKDLVAVVDLKTRTVVARWPVAPGGHPVGMAMDTATHRLFVGCRNPQMLVVMNAGKGAVEASLPIGAGVDATRFDAGEAFASTGDGNLTVAGQQNGKWVVEQTVATAKGARTMGLDRTTHRIFLPTAELEPAATGRPRPKPGTFMIVEVGHP
jgi:DNA-binding beta-propeller fold protein YncE